MDAKSERIERVLSEVAGESPPSTPDDTVRVVLHVSRGYVGWLQRLMGVLPTDWHPVPGDNLVIAARYWIQHRQRAKLRYRESRIGVARGRAGRPRRVAEEAGESG